MAFIRLNLKYTFYKLLYFDLNSPDVYYIIMKESQPLKSLEPKSK